MAAATSLKGLRGFLGLTGYYYRKFVQNYGLITTPLAAMLKKNSFNWTEEAVNAFHRLKQAMIEPPVLALPDFSKEFVIECDASGRGISAVLTQQGRQIAYLSQALKGRSLDLSTYEKELLALVLSVQKWRPYLLGQRFTVCTDQQSLKYLLEQRIGTPTQQKWLSKLLGYDFTAEYRKGKENKVADALSRVDEGTVTALSEPKPTWIEFVKEDYKRSEELQQLDNNLRKEN